MNPKRYAGKVCAVDPAHGNERLSSNSRCVKCNVIQRIKYGKTPSAKEIRKSKRRQESARAHGLSMANFNDMLTAQNFTCAICPRPVSAGTETNIDHDKACCPGRNSCGKCVRGLLCRNCNTALGVFGDDPARLRIAAAYVESALDAGVN